MKEKITTINSEWANYSPVSTFWKEAERVIGENGGKVTIWGTSERRKDFIAGCIFLIMVGLMVWAGLELIK